MNNPRALRIVVAAAIAALAGAIFGGIWISNMSGRPEGRKPKLPLTDPVPEKTSIALSAPGIRDPQLVSAEESMLDDSDIVIGVVVNGEPRAYLRRAFGNSPSHHVVNDRIGSIPVTITHCDQKGSTRVLTSDKVETAMTIGCGGWLSQQGMAIRIDDQVYAQLSPELPLQDLPFEEMTWKEWLESHPNTKVYDGSQSEM